MNMLHKCYSCLDEHVTYMLQLSQSFRHVFRIELYCLQKSLFKVAQYLSLSLHSTFSVPVSIIVSAQVEKNVR